MGDSVGKISLDLEVQSDINNQISELSSNIGKQMKSSMDGLVKAAFKNINKDMKSSMQSVTKTMDEGMKATSGKVKNATASMVEGVKKSMKEAAQESEGCMESMAENMVSSIQRPLERLDPRRLIRGLLDKFRMKDTPEPAYDNPESVSMSTGNTVSTDTVRGPPAEDASRVITLKNQIEETRQKAELLRQELAQMEKVQVPTQEYIELEKNIEKAEDTLLRLLNRQEKMEESGVRKNSTAWKGLQNDIQAAEKKLLNYEAAMDTLKNSGNGFTLGSDTEEYAKKESQLRALTGKMDAYRAKLAEVQAKEGNAAKSSGGFVTALQRIQQVCGKVTSGISKLGGFFTNLIRKFKQAITHSDKTKRSFNSTKNSANSLGRGILNLGNMFRLLLLRMAMRGVIQGAKEGFQNLAQYSAEVNNSISSMLSALTRLKNSFATAFAPILNVVSPILTKFINMMADAITYIGMFFAALTGQSSFTKALGVTEDYAASLGNASDSADGAANSTGDANDAAKEYKKTLMGFDDINKLESQNDSSGSGSGSPSGNIGGNTGTSIGDMFETVKIDSWLTDLASKFKSVLSDIFAPIKKAWADYGQGVMDAWKYALSEVKGLIGDIGATWMKVWTDGTGYTLVKNILLVLTEIGLWIGDIAVAWRKAWDNYGETLVRSIFNLLNAILVLLYSLSTAFRNVWNSGVGERVCGLILQILTNIVQTVTNLTTRFTEAWNEGGRGERIAAAIFAIIDKILTFVRNITQATKEWASKLDFGPLLSAIGGFLEKIGTVIDNIVKKVEPFYKNVVLPFLTWLIQTALPWVIDKLGNILVFLSEHIGVVGLVVAAWLSFKVVMAACNAALAIHEAYLKFIKIQEAAATVKKIAHTVATNAYTVAQWLANAALSAFPVIFIIAAIAAVVAAVVWLVENWDLVKEKAIEVWEKIKETFSGIGDWFKARFTEARDAIVSVFSGIGNWFGARWGDIKNAFSSAGAWFKNIFSNAWANVKNAWSSAGNWFSNLGSSIKNTFSGVGSWLTSTFSNAWASIKSVFSDFGSYFSGIWNSLIDIVRSPINSIIGILNRFIQGVAYIVNSIGNMFNSMSIKIPDWVPVYGGGSMGFSFPTWSPGGIPYLAQGGIVDTPTLAMVGEAGTEAVMPLENNTGWIDNLAGQIAEKIGTGGNGVTKKEMESIVNAATGRIVSALEALGFYVDSELLAKAVKKGMGSRDRRMNFT